MRRNVSCGSSGGNTVKRTCTPASSRRARAGETAKGPPQRLLEQGYRSFAEIKNNLFIYGHSLAGNDQHWFELIADGKVNRLFVSLYGDPDNDTNRAIRDRGVQMGAT